MPRSVRVSADGHEVAERLDELIGAAPHRRFLVGLAGPPGVGKSRLAAAIAASFGVPVVPMDGFHRPEAELRARGRLAAKGAPDTFDAEAYAALLARVRAGGAAVRAPAFHHWLPDPVPDELEVPAEAGLVVTEGNYLLLDEPRWRAARAEIDQVWHLVADEARRHERLVQRHVDAGRRADDAASWVAEVDEVNARQVEAASARADLLLDLTQWWGGLALRH